MRGRRMTGLALVAAVLLGAGGLAACSDDDGNGEGIALEEIDDESVDDETTTTAAPDDEDDDSSDTTLPGGDLAGGCAEFTSAFTALATSITGELDEDALATLDDAIAQAPEELRGDLERYVQFFRDYAAALEEAGIDPSDPSSVDPEDAEAMSELIDQFSSDEFLQASEAIGEFIASDCAAG